MATLGRITTNIGHGWYLYLDWKLDYQTASGNDSAISWKMGYHNTGIIATLSNVSIVFPHKTYSVALSDNPIQINKDVQLISGGFDITHNIDGTQELPISISGDVTRSGATIHLTGSRTWDLPTIPLEAVFSSTPASYSQPQSLTIGVSNVANKFVRASIVTDNSSDGSKTWITRDLGQISGEYRFEPTDEEWNALNSSNTISNSWQTRCILTTYLDDNYTTSVGWPAQYSPTYNIVSANPIFSNFSYRDKEESVVLVTGNDQVLVQGLSSLEATILTAQKMIPQKSALPTQYSCSFGGKNISTPYSNDSDVTINFGPSTIAETQRLTVRAFDSRTNQTAIFKDIVTAPYTEPSLTGEIARLNGFEAQCSIDVVGTYSPVIIDNIAKNTVAAYGGIRYRYKKVTEEEWQPWVLLTSTSTNGKTTLPTILVNLDNQYQWDVQVTVIDSFQKEYTLDLSVSIGIPIFRIGTDGKCYNNEQTVAVTADKTTCPFPVGYIYMSVDDTDPSDFWEGTTWEPFAQGRTVVGVDADQPEFAEVEQEGGSKEVALSVNQMPSHNHGGGLFRDQSSTDYMGVNGGGVSGTGIAVTTTKYAASLTLRAQGGGQAHENMPPYVAVNLFKRIS